MVRGRARIFKSETNLHCFGNGPWSLTGRLPTQHRNLYIFQPREALWREVAVHTTTVVSTLSLRCTELQLHKSQQTSP